MTRKTKSKAAPKAPAKRKTAPPAAKANGVSKVVEAFGARPGTNRARLLDRLAKNLGKPVAVADLSKAVYGKEDQVGALAMVLKGAFWMIATRKTGHKLTKGGERGAVTYTLTATK